MNSPGLLSRASPPFLNYHRSVAGPSSPGGMVQTPSGVAFSRNLGSRTAFPPPSTGSASGGEGCLAGVSGAATMAPPLAPLLSPPTPAVEAPFKKAPFKEAPLGRAIGSSGGGGPMHLTGLRAPSPFPRNPDPRTAAAEAEEHSSCPGRGPSLQPTTTPPPPPSLSLPRSRPPSAWRRSQGAAAPAEARPPASSLSSLSSSPSSPSQASKSLGASRGRVEAAGRGLERRSAKPRHKPAALPASDGSVIDV